MILDMLDKKPGKLRRDWGTQNMVGMAHGNPAAVTNAARLQHVQNKIATFCNTAIYPQQLTVPRQYATTQEGVSIFRIMSGRKVGGYTEPGFRVVVLENAQQSRFVISRLFDSEADARGWAHKEMGVP